MKIKNFVDVKSLLLDNKNLKQTIFKNTFWLGIAELVDKGIGLLIIIWVARYFGPEIYGKYAFALSFVSLFAIFSDFGFSTLTVREVSRNKSRTREYIDNILAMKLVLGLITLGLIVLFIQFLDKEPEVVKLVYFLGIYVVINTFNSFFRSIFQANEKMQYEPACSAIQSLSRLGLVAFFILNKNSILEISYAYIGASLIGTFLSMGTVWYFFSRFFLKVDFKICKEILREAWPFALGGMFIIALDRINILMLSLMKTDLVVGWYNAAYQPTLNLMIIPALFMASVYPKLSYFYLNSKDFLIKLYERSLKYIFFLSIILFPLLFIFARQIILLLYGVSYTNSIIIFRILLWASFFAFMNSVFIYTLNAINKRIIYTKIIALGLVINIILNFLFIPKYSYIGASISALILQFLIFLLLFLSVRKFKENEIY